MTQTRCRECPGYLIQEPYQHISISMAVPKRSPFKRSLNRAIMLSHENGLISMWRLGMKPEFPWHEAPECHVEDDLTKIEELINEMQSNVLHFRHFHFMARDISYFYGLVVFTFLCEMLCALYNKTRSKWAIIQKVSPIKNLSRADLIVPFEHNNDPPPIEHKPRFSRAWVKLLRVPYLLDSPVVSVNELEQIHEQLDQERVDR